MLFMVSYEIGSLSANRCFDLRSEADAFIAANKINWDRQSWLILREVSNNGYGVGLLVLVEDSNGRKYATGEPTLQETSQTTFGYDKLDA